MKRAPANCDSRTYSWACSSWFQCTEINMVSPGWVSTEHITHGSSAASNSAPHLPLFDLEVPSAKTHHHSPIHRIQPPRSPPKQHLAFSPRWHKKRGWRCVSHVDDEVLVSNSWVRRCRSLPHQKKNETAPFPTSVIEMLGWSQVLFKASKPFTPRPWLWKDNYQGWWISTSMCKCSLLWLFPKYSVNYRNLRRLLIKYIKYVKYKDG